MAVLLVQLQAPDNGLYDIPWTDCTEKPSEGGKHSIRKFTFALRSVGQ